MLGAEREDAESCSCVGARVAKAVRFVNLTHAAQHGVFARAFTRKTLKIALFKCEKSPSQPTSRRALFRLISSPVLWILYRG